MRRKRIFIGAAAVLTVISVIAVTGISAQADVRDIKSRGNFVLDSGKMSIYASDIDYLQSEVKTLYSELPSVLEINASGTGTARRDELRSKGVINYKNGTVILDSSDFTLLADEIDNLESEYKANTVVALNDINTYFKIDGSVTHDQREENLSAMYANTMSLDGICNGILQSQSVDHLEATPIIADNLTAGTAAWVNGTCIIGNGADNERAYKKGKEDGEDGDGEDMDMNYAYHVHKNGDGEEVDEETVYALTDPGGCYVEDGHTHDKTGTCPFHNRTSSSKCGGAIVYRYHWCIDYDGDGNDDWANCAFCSKCGSHKSQGYSHDTCQDTTTVTEKVYDCGNYTNTWKIGCGKEVGQIESVTIIIRKNNK